MSNPEPDAPSTRAEQADPDEQAERPDESPERLDQDAPGTSLFREDEDAVEPNEPG
jgi:hypothetical protein